MRTSMLSLAALAAAVVGVGCEGIDNYTDPVTAWESELLGANEVPALATPSLARGTATFSIASATGTTLTYSIRIETLPAAPFTITAAHLHQANVGSSAAAAVNLCGAGTAPACNTLTAAGVLATGTATLTAAQVTAMRAFGMYVNVHTAANIGGEIRGQLRIVAP